MTFSATVVTVPNLNTHVRDNTLHLYEHRGDVRAVASKTTNYTATASDGLLLCSNTITITLPAAATVGAEFTLTIKNVGSGTITIDGNGSETIDGATTQTLSQQYQALTVTSDGSNWHASGNVMAGVIKSIQYGTAVSSAGATSWTATITSVTTSKTVLHWLGQSGSNLTNEGARLTLTNSTTVTATADTASAAGDNNTVGFVAVEYF